MCEGNIPLWGSLCFYALGQSSLVHHAQELMTRVQSALEGARNAAAQQSTEVQEVGRRLAKAAGSDAAFPAPLKAPPCILYTHRRRKRRLRGA